MRGVHFVRCDGRTDEISLCTISVTTFLGVHLFWTVPVTAVINLYLDLLSDVVCPIFSIKVINVVMTSQQILLIKPTGLSAWCIFSSVPLDTLNHAPFPSPCTELPISHYMALSFDMKETLAFFAFSPQLHIHICKMFCIIMDH
jgi:hypothetical protein